MAKASYEDKTRKMQLEKHEYNTYDASKSKYSTSSAITGALSAATELEEAISSTRFRFLSTSTFSVVAGGDDVDELVSSSDSSISSSSWLLSASGASDTGEARFAGRGPASGRGGYEIRNW
jgi:hypothetical protein